MTSPEDQPGRACSVSYRYSPAVLARAPDFEADTLYVVGGLYGNPCALETILEMAAEEPATVILVFNGDFNWFNVDPDSFRSLNETVLAHRALRGNVETEIAGASGRADCGCGYPSWVSDAEVARSNEIILRLHETARPFRAIRSALAQLPMHAVASVGATRVGIVHGDAESLAGWSYTPGALGRREGSDRLRSHFEAGDLDVIASSHTCRPLALTLNAGRKRALFNNGAAGMPNFRGDGAGLITRVSTYPAPGALYGTLVGDVHVGALRVPYRHDRWLDAFLKNWVEGSAAYTSYFDRIARGANIEVEAAAAGLDRHAL